MTRRAVAALVGAVLVGVQQAGLVGGVRIVAGGAVGVAEVASAVGGTEGAVGFVTLEAQGRHGGDGQMLVVRAVSRMAGGAVSFFHGSMHHGRLRPGRYLDMAFGAKLRRLPQELGRLIRGVGVVAGQTVAARRGLVDRSHAADHVFVAAQAQVDVG